MPANEHLTMQIARQVYGLKTAENAIIFFKNGSPAYITKRLDVKSESGKWGAEDFASLAGKTTDIAGAGFKYDYSYEEAGMLIQKFVPAWRVEIEKYFSLVVFNFLISNGDAHLKNFALIESSKGDYLLSSAYDLINTRLHVDDADFTEFAGRIGVAESRVEKLLYPFLEKQRFLETLINRSFLSDAGKRAYSLMYQTRRNYLIA